jgi:capsular polysaccharide transport system ATP-binding protein
MSIRFTDVHASVSFQGAKIPVLKGVSLEIPDGARIGILGLPKSGKTTLLRIMCGTVTAELGRVERTSRTSWPIPMTAFLSNNAPVARNVRFLAKLYGIADEDFPRRIAEMLGIEEFLNIAVQKCPRIVKPRLAFGLGIGIDFDIYLFDGQLIASDKDFKERAMEIAAERLNGRGYVVATANPKEAEQHCDSVYVLEAGRARYFDAMTDGVEYFKQLLAAQKQKAEAASESKVAEGSDEEIEGPGDIDVLAAAVADEVE